MRTTLLLLALMHATPAAAAAVQDVLVVLQGWASCRDSIGPADSRVWPLIERLAGQLRQRTGARPPVLVSCFGSGQHGFDLRYMVGSGSSIERANDFDDLASRIARLAGGRAAARFHVFGHSHGGWLAMRTALALPSSVAVTSLATIDPISYVLCTPQVVARFILGSIGSLRDNPACQSSPPDLRTRWPTLRQRTGRWLHAYQSRYTVLRATRIEEADQNLFVSFNHADLDSRSHTEIKTDARVWDAYQRMVLQSLGEGRFEPPAE